MLTQEQLKELLYYNPDTGIFLWNSNWKYLSTKVNAAGYLQVNLNGTIYLQHRLAWLYIYGVFPNDQIDHINCITTDNRLINLRVVNHRQNGQNRIKASRNSKTGILGVCYLKRTNSFKAQISIEGKNTHLGYFRTAEEAYTVYITAKRKHHLQLL